MRFVIRKDRNERPNSSNCIELIYAQTSYGKASEYTTRKAKGLSVQPTSASLINSTSPSTIYMYTPTTVGRVKARCTDGHESKHTQMVLACTSKASIEGF